MKTLLTSILVTTCVLGAQAGSFLRFTFTGGSTMCQLSELAFYDANTNRINTGIVQTNNTVAVSEMLPGYWQLSRALGTGGTETPAKLFDGNTGTKLCVTSNGTYPYSYTFRFADEVRPEFYNMATANDHCERSPTGWYIEMSQDGENWDEVERRSSNSYPSTTYTWFAGSGTPWRFSHPYCWGRRFAVGEIPVQRYAGVPVTPSEITVTDSESGTPLSEGVDYEITGCENNDGRGVATVIVSGTAGGDYAGWERRVEFTIISEGRPGMRQRQLSGWNNTDDYQWESDPAVPGALLAATTGGSCTYGGKTYSMGSTMTWAYRGYMFMYGGLTYYCSGSYDDSVYLRIIEPKSGSSKEVLKVGSMCAQANGSYTPAEDGWYLVDVRVGNNGGGVGPRNDVAGMDGAVVWNTNGLSTCRTADKQYWHIFLNTENDVYLYDDYPAKLEIEPIADQLYDGTPCEPAVVVRDYFYGTVLVKDVDYTLVYSDNDRNGTATVKACGLSGKYAKIIGEANFQVIAPELSASVPDITVEESAEPPYRSTVTVLDAKTSQPLVEGTDYVLAYSGDGTFGPVTVTVTGLNDYALAGGLELHYTVGGIVKVAPGGSGDGRSWSSPMSFASALAALAQGGGEIRLQAGTYTDVSASAATEILKPLKISGGYTGDDAHPAARSVGAASVFDGANSRELVRIASGSGIPVTFERVVFKRAKTQALVKTGAGDLVISGCVFTANNTATQRTHGRGLAVAGSSAAKVTLIDTEFNGNRCNGLGYSGAEWLGCGFGAYIDRCARLVMDRCSFTTNGVALAANGTCYSGKFSGSAICILSTPVTARGCRFAGNVSGISGGSDYWVNNDSVAGKDGATLFLDGACGGSAFTNCVWIGNDEWCSLSHASAASHGGAVSIYLSNTADTVDFRNCTIAYNLSEGMKSPAGLNVVRGTVTVGDSIIYGNVRGYPDQLVGADADVKSAGRLTIVDSLLTDRVIPAVSCANEDVITIDGESVMTGVDPLFVTPVSRVLSYITITGGGYRYFNGSAYAALAGFDAHLLSAGGYLLNGGAAGPATNVTSVAVDGGNVASDFSREPSPNGGRVNLGAYGNSAEASRTAVGQPSVAAFTVGSPEGDCRPEAVLTLGLASGIDYLATVTIVMRSAGEIIASNTFVNAANGDVISLKAPCYLDAGTALSANAIVTAGGAERVDADAEGATAGVKPSFCGHGGGSGVLHVRRGADCLMNGSNWTDAFPDIITALDAIDSETREIWVSEGEYRLTVSLEAAQPLALRGGFACTEDAATERDIAKRTMIDNSDVYDMITLANGGAAPVVVDGFDFVRARRQALIKSGAGDLSVSNCSFRLNGANYSDIDGRGIKADGASAASLALRNCVFAGNRFMSGYELPGNGCGAAVRNFADATIDECLFVTNGLRLGSYAMAYCGRSKGSALYVSATPTVMRGCRFAGNVGGYYGTSTEGACVYFDGACGGTAITNCVWTGNEEWLKADSSSAGAGALTVGLANAADRFSICNCTIAYNLTETRYGAAGLNVLKGSVSLENSIVYGNFAGNPSPSAGADVNVRSGGTLEIAYTLLTGTNSTEVTGSGSIVYREGVLLGDPLLVDSYLHVNDFVTHAASGYAYFNTAASTLGVLAGLDVHLKSSGGYVLNGGTEGPSCDDNSPGIDAADPEISCLVEPLPNGSRRNLGAYGGTVEASKTPVIADFELATVPFAVYDGEAVTPEIAIRLREGGAALDPADFTIEYSDNAATGIARATVTGRTGTDYEGQSASVSFRLIPRIRVTAEAEGDDDGSDWEHPSAWSAAFARAVATGAELWLKAGTYTGVAASEVSVFEYPVTVRGGFAGTETSAGERVKGTRSVIDGANSRNPFRFSNGTPAPVVLDGLRFYRSQSRAIYKTGAGDLEVTGCDFDQNGTSQKQIDGRGIYASGGTFATLTVTDTTFTGHRSSSYVEWTGSGNGIYADQFALMRLDGCVFEQNGINLGVAGSTYCGKSAGSAIYAFSTRVEAERCRFAGNVSGITGASDFTIGSDGVKGKDGGTVYLDGACGGSVFRNCAWAGNCDWPAVVAGANGAGITYFGGAVVVNLAAVSDTVDFRYCTLAYNLTGGYYVPGGINIVKGTVSVEDSLVYGNVRGRPDELVGADIAVKANGRLSLARTFVTSFETNHVSTAEQANLSVESATVKTLDPLFVTSYDDIHSLTVANAAGVRYFSTSLSTLAAVNVHLLGRCGYFDEKTGARVRGSLGRISPAIDAGDKHADFTGEPEPNGGRVNLGAYGNTPWATMSHSPGGVLRVR